MGASDKDRSTAKRIRERISKGKASAHDREWLADYEATRRSRVVARERAPSAEEPSPPRERVQTVAPDPTGTWVPIEDAEEDEDEEDEEPREALAPESEPEADSALLAPAPATCTIKDCPACAGRLRPGPQICATTGEKVYPEISMGTARMIAGFVLWLIEAGAAVFYKTDIPPATALVRDELAKSLIEVVRRRFGVVAMVDDLIAPFWPITMYVGTVRAAGNKALAERNGKP